METQNNVPENSSILNETILNVDNNTSDNNIVVPNDPFYNLIKKQAKEFEEFGKRVSLDLQKSYEEYLKEKTNKMGKDPIEIEKVFKKYEEKIFSQSQLIDTLRARIEELETDSIIKDQDIRNLQQEFNDFKKEIRSVLVTPTKDNAKSDSNINGKNLGRLDDRFSDFQPTTEKSWMSTQNERSDYSFNHDAIGSTPIGIGSTGNLDNSPMGYDIPISTPAVDSYYDLTTDQYEQQWGENISEDNYYSDEEDIDVNSQINETHPINESEYFANEESYNFGSYPPEDFSGQKRKSNQKIHAKIEKTFKELSLKREKANNATFDYLRGDFNINFLLEYENSVYFKSLSKNTKKCVRKTINEGLRRELCTKKKRVSQPIKVYVHRGLIPPLPAGITSYAEYQNTKNYDSLHEQKKRMVQKVISVESCNDN